MTTAFSSISEFLECLKSSPLADQAVILAASDRNGQLTKPPGALGRLEDLAIWFSGWQGKTRPSLDKIQVVVFAANHGFCVHNISAFPVEVTAQMVANFISGGAAINQLCHAFGAQMSVVSLDLDQPTADFTVAPAMSDAELIKALNAGWMAVDPNCDLFIPGEMGIGNTTAAAAIASALFKGKAQDWTGRGTGVDDSGLDRKIQVISNALEYHKDILNDPIQVLRCLGGREIAAMAGAIAAARHYRIPVILDGFICSAAAAVLNAAVPGALDHTVAGHQSAESAHQNLLQKLGKEPLLSLGLRLGEGSGAMLAVAILKGAIACHSGMATFAEAMVAQD